MEPVVNGEEWLPLFQYVKLAGIKTKAKCTDGEWGEEDYHSLPYGQLCLLSKERKTGGWKSKQEIEREEGNGNSNKGFRLTTSCSFISNLENSSGHACLDELEKFHALRPATLTQAISGMNTSFRWRANLVQTYCRAFSGPLMTPRLSLAPYC